MAAVAATFALAAVPANRVNAGGKDCSRKSFETSLVKSACSKGGQKAAKKAMKDWVKTAKKKKAGLECGTCHSEMAPGYPLKSDGLKLYKELGGK